MAVASACSSQSCPAAAPANSSRAPGGPGARRVSVPPRCPGSTHPRLAAAARAAAPPLGAAARRRLGPLHSARVPEEVPPRPHRTPAWLPAPPAALRPLRSHPYAGPRPPRPSDAASPHSAGDRSDNPRLARGAPRPSGPHPSGPPPGPLVGASPPRPETTGRRCLLPIGSRHCRSRSVPTSASASLSC